MTHFWTACARLAGLALIVIGADAWRWTAYAPTSDGVWDVVNVLIGLLFIALGTALFMWEPFE